MSQPQQQNQKQAQPSESKPATPEYVWIRNTEPRLFHLHGKSRKEQTELDGSTTVLIEPIVISLRPGLNRVELSKLALTGFGWQRGDVPGSVREDASEWQGAVYRCNPLNMSTHEALAVVAETPDPTVIKAWRAAEKRQPILDALTKWSPPRRVPAEQAVED